MQAISGSLCARAPAVELCLGRGVTSTDAGVPPSWASKALNCAHQTFLLINRTVVTVFVRFVAMIFDWLLVLRRLPHQLAFRTLIVCLSLGLGLCAVSASHAAGGLGRSPTARTSVKFDSAKPTKSASKRAEAASKRKKSQTAKTKKSRKAVALAAAAAAGLAAGAAATSATDAEPSRAAIKASAAAAGQAEIRLIEVYRAIGNGKTAQALVLADALVRDYPNFQLAQLVRGDLMLSRLRPISKLGEVPDTTARLASLQLAELREESRQRLQALRERPTPNTLPTSFLALSGRNKHVIAVDVSRSRLYLFENTASGARLLTDFYVSVGKAGVEKFAEGDLRTPLGVYYLNNSLDPKGLKDLYGAGALTLNYPNPLDTRRGKSGSGIWLHGTPQTQFSRAPKSTDGCIVVSNPDFLKIASLVEMRNTPIVVSQSLQWATPAAIEAEKKAFVSQLDAWRTAKVNANVPKWLDTYAPDFRSFEKTLRDWYPGQETAMKLAVGQAIELKDMSVLQSKDATGVQQALDAMVVTFTEVRVGAKTTPTVRQYWSRVNNQWKIVFEGVIS